MLDIEARILPFEIIRPVQQGRIYGCYTTPKYRLEEIMQPIIYAARSVWELAVKVMNIFENGEIKNQKLEEEEPVLDPTNETKSLRSPASSRH